VVRNVRPVRISELKDKSGGVTIGKIAINQKDQRRPTDDLSYSLSKGDSSLINVTKNFEKLNDSFFRTESKKKNSKIADSFYKNSESDKKELGLLTSIKKVEAD
jgi:hypothetical protein